MEPGRVELHMSAHTRGQEVYNIHGQAGSYVVAAAGGHIVEPIYDDEHGEERLGDPETWREVFAVPPTARLHEDCAKLEARLREWRAQLDDCRAAKTAAERAQEDLRKRIAAQPDLRDLDLWLKGEVTHIVTLNYYGLSIDTVDAALVSGNDRGDTSLRLLNLRVDPKAQKYWVAIAGYSDGSGSQKRCLLATSMQHAVARAEEYLAAAEKSYDRKNEVVSLARCVMKYGGTVSAEARAKVEAEDAAARARGLESARKALEGAQATLQAAEEAVARATGASK